MNYSYPNLWNGCVGAWCPSEDRSRSDRLTDFSQFGNHGVLTNMDPATDWVPSQGKIALDFDGTLDHIVAKAIQPVHPFSFGGWFNSRTSNTVFCTLGSSSVGNRYVHLGLDSSRRAWSSFRPDQSFFPDYASTQTFSLNTWLHIFTVCESDTLRSIYVNGSLVATNTGNYVVPSMIDTLYIATFRQVSGTAVYNIQADDVRVYNRALAPAEIATLALRRGIAYETNRIRRYFLPAAGGATATPGTASLTLTTFVPSIIVPSPITATPSTASLTLATFAPVVSTPQSITPGNASLTLATFAPAVSTPVAVVPATAALTLTTFEPSVLTPQTIVPATTALTLTTFAPTILVGDAKVIVPTAATLTLATFVPTVIASAAIVVTPTTATFSLTTFAPTIAASGAVSTTPTTSELTLTTFAPVVSTPQTIVPATASLTLTMLAPEVRLPVVVTPALLQLVIAPYNPNVANPVTLTPGTASLILTGYRPSTDPITDSLILQYYYHLLG